MTEAQRAVYRAAMRWYQWWNRMFTGAPVTDPPRALWNACERAAAKDGACVGFARSAKIADAVALLRESEVLLRECAEFCEDTAPDGAPFHSDLGAKVRTFLGGDGGVMGKLEALAKRLDECGCKFRIRRAHPCSSIRQ